MACRRYERYASALDVTVFMDGLPISRGRIGNFNKKGAFIYPASPALQLTRPVELEISRRDRKPLQKSKRISARVVHQSNGGAGVDFTGDSTNEDEQLAQVLSTIERN